VLHHIGVDLGLEHRVVGFEAGRELDVADLIALLLQLWLDADLELVDIRPGTKPTRSSGFAGCCAKASPAAKGERAKRPERRNNAVFMSSYWS
jgi:hypothetical protein